MHIFHHYFCFSVFSFLTQIPKGNQGLPRVAFLTTYLHAKKKFSYLVSVHARVMLKALVQDPIAPSPTL